MRNRAGIVAAVVVVLALGAWGYSWYATHSARASIVALVNDTSERLRAALQAKPDQRHDFSGGARAVGSHVERLRGLRNASLVELADAADGYFVSAREILRRLDAMQSARERLSASVGALSSHIAADRGGATWTREAVRLHEDVARDFRELRIAAESYASLLESLPQAQAKIAPHVNPASLADEKTIADARTAALDALARVDENTKKVTSLDAYRGARRR